jgi:hypothetical protein
VKAHLKRGISLAPGMEIGYVVKDASRWEVEPERWASKFDAGYYGKLLGRRGRMLDSFRSGLKRRYRLVSDPVFTTRIARHGFS